MNSRATILQKLAMHSSTESAPPELPGDSAGLPVRQNFAESYRRFVELAAATQMTVAEVAAYDSVPAVVQQYLHAAGLPAAVMLDASVPIAAKAWSAAGINAQVGDVRRDNDVYVSAGLAAIAECGAVVIASGERRALRNDFLARTHVVVVPAAHLLPVMGDFWSIMRADIGAGRLAREYCMVTGPSRTADLGVPAKLGAHGPAHVHVIIVGAA